MERAIGRFPQPGSKPTHNFEKYMKTLVITENLKNLNRRNAVKSLMLGLLMVGLSSLVSVAQSTTHLTLARGLVAQLKSQGDAGLFFDANGVEYNKYGAAWADSFITWGNPAYVHAVCNNFYIRLMMDAYPGWTAKNAGFASSSPNSGVLHDAVEANVCGYNKVNDFSNWQAGDLLVVKYYDDSANSGHTMLLDDALTVSTAADGTVKWAVKVIDCSSGVHTSDSRVFPNYTSSGAGTGWMYVYTKNGQITAYSWSQTKGSKVYTPDLRHMTLGRQTF